MARRDKVPLDTPIGNENFEGWCVEPELKIDAAQGTISGHIRFYGATSRKFQKSVAFSLPFNAARTEAVMSAITQALINQNPALAGTRVVETVTDIDEDVSP